MSDHPDSTTAPKSIGELSENIIAVTRTKMDAKIASAMRDLEPLLRDLSHMTRIAADIADSLFERPESEGEYLVYKLAMADRDAVLFAVNDIENRTLAIKERYYSALSGGRA